MKLVIITGRSGSGKSSALHALEDEGFYCVDNIPASLLLELADHLKGQLGKLPGIAVSLDVRNVPRAFEQFPVILRSLKESGIECLIARLDATDECLVQRYSATRRKHPLSSNTISLTEAIGSEKQLLNPIIRYADIYVDTTALSVHDIRQQILQRIGSSRQIMTLQLQSFGFKHGIPMNVDFVFDVRCLPNPFWVESLKGYTGLDAPVVRFLEQEPSVTEMTGDIALFIEKWIDQFELGQRSYMTVAFGCTGGQHRSVYICEKLGERLKTLKNPIQKRHRELTAR